MAVRILVLVVGAFVVVATVGSAIKTVILPRAVASRLTRRVFRAVRGVFNLIVGPRASFERTDRILALYAPVALVVLVIVWLAMLMLGFWAMFWGNGVDPAGRAFVLSGSSLTTLGFEQAGEVSNDVLSVTEAVLGLGMVALLITFLPTLYGTFARRELFVTHVEVRAGAPPTARELLVRLWAIGEPEQRLADLWTRSEAWFADLGESHTSFPMLVFFRSPQPEHSWITTAGAVLDAASLVASSVDVPRNPDANLTIRSGYIGLRRIGSFLGVPYDPDPAPDDPISITRAEYETVLDGLVAAGVPVRADRDQGWRDFAGWRVNYDAVLQGLALLASAPPAPWVGDRGITGSRTGLALTRRRARG